MTQKKPELLSRELVYSGKTFNVCKYTVKVNRRTITRDIIERRHGVVIVPVDHKGHVLMVREYCAGSNSFILSLPGGSIEEGTETVEAHALRELREETGYRAKRLIKLQFAFTHPSTSNRKSHSYLGLDLVKDPLPSSGEIIEVVRLPLDEAIRRVYVDFVSDVSTMANLCMARDKLASTL